MKKAAFIAIKGIALSILALVSIQSYAQGDIEANILNRLSEARPDLEFGAPTPSPIPGYYEVAISGGPVVYVSEDGAHFFSGELYFAEPGGFTNATEMARSMERADVLANLDKSGMIIFAPEQTKAVMTVFTDVTCGYCRKLHDQMAEMNALGIEVRYMAYPRSGIERNGTYTNEFVQTVKAWCADDRKEAMNALKGGYQLDEEVCEGTPVPEHYQIGAEFGVTGTPAIVLPDGTLLPGFRSPEEYATVLGINPEG